VALAQACRAKPSAACGSNLAAAAPNWNSATNHGLRPGRRSHIDDKVQLPHRPDMKRRADAAVEGRGQDGAGMRLLFVKGAPAGGYKHICGALVKDLL